jgi:hypothetical protein
MLPPQPEVNNQLQISSTKQPSMYEATGCVHLLQRIVSEHSSTYINIISATHNRPSNNQ